MRYLMKENCIGVISPRSKMGFVKEWANIHIIVVIIKITTPILISIRLKFPRVTARIRPNRRINEKSIWVFEILS